MKLNFFQATRFTDAVACRPLSVSIYPTRLGAWLIAASLFVFCISDTMLALEVSSSPLVKLIAFGLVGAAIVLRPRFHRGIFLVGPLLISLIIGQTRAYDQSAGIEEFLRFLSPVLITIGLFAYRDNVSPVLKTFFFIVFSNDLYQAWAYLAGITGLPMLLPVRLDSGLFIRAQGWMGFFSEFSFINFCAFVFCRRYRPTKLSRHASWIFVSFTLLGFSFKILPALALYPLTTRKLRWQSWLCIAAGSAALMAILASGYLDTITGLVVQKIGFYVLDGNSARAESYRVMTESLVKWNFLGEGLGSFGGPASVKYGSPLYSMYHFNWYGLGAVLKTTDTFYPHLFVELGLFGGVIWLWIVLQYGNSNHPNKTWLLFVSMFCFDNAFSLAFVSASYVFSALLAMYLFRHEGTVTRSAASLDA